MLIYAKPLLACFKHSNLFKVNELKLFTVLDLKIHKNDCIGLEFIIGCGLLC